jgi:hypothetical protein
MQPEDVVTDRQWQDKQATTATDMHATEQRP